jgi:hypothetical protein
MRAEAANLEAGSPLANAPARRRATAAASAPDACMGANLESIYIRSGVEGEE